MKSDARSDDRVYSSGVLVVLHTHAFGPPTTVECTGVYQGWPDSSKSKAGLNKSLFCLSRQHAVIIKAKQQQQPRSNNITQVLLHKSRDGCRRRQKIPKGVLVSSDHTTFNVFGEFDW